LEDLEQRGHIKLSIVPIDEDGNVIISELENLLSSHDNSFVSLMHANNEVGNILPINEVGALCKKYNAIFHSDTVQSVGHYEHNLEQEHVDFITCAAHKFHGPKGVGALYINSRIKVRPFITGGPQERNMRGGTENVYGIVGLAKALEIAHRDMETDRTKIESVKNYMAEQIKEHLPEATFNGGCMNDGLYTVLNVCLPSNSMAEMMIYNLDIAGVGVSGGSACSSGSNTGSHVLNALKVDSSRPSIRFSFSKFNTKEEVDYAVSKLKEMYTVNA
ncbi:MAG: aminotransferase class V-fold PLP-dependent enzyme, partial [Bacteroidia bacterium]|nr:aminotransferase class V-fold PLP-dependent enzyme [Bacteroidia bacterium]